MRAENDGIFMLEPLDVRWLPEDEKRIDEPLSPEWLIDTLNDGVSDDALRVDVRAPGHATLRISRVSRQSETEPVVRVEGEVSVHLTRACVRCLSDVPLSLFAHIDQTFFPRAADREDTDDTDDSGRKPRTKRHRPVVELPRAALDETAYDHHMIDLAAVVREALLLEIDENPTCPDEAACGARTQKLISDAAEAHGPGSVDPRLAGLLDLKNKLGYGKISS